MVFLKEFFKKLILKKSSDDKHETWPKVQLVACLTADPGVPSSIPSRSHTFMVIDHDIISTAILHLPLIQEGLLSVTSVSMCTKYRLTVSQACPGKRVVRSTDYPDMTLAVD